MVLYIACIAHIVCVAGEYRLHVHSWHIDFILTDRKWDAHPSSLSLFFPRKFESRPDAGRSKASGTSRKGPGADPVILLKIGP